MKRYLVFTGRDYYPEGGMNDFLNDFDTIEECQEALHKEMMEGYNSEFDDLDDYIKYKLSYSWANIYDTQDRKEIWSR